MNRDPFAAIADPTRREIIDLLAQDNLNINQIAAHFDTVSRQAVTKQLKYLEDSGLITIEKNGREKYCYLTLDNLNEVNQWIGKYRKFWNKKLDRLDEYLKKK
ncbi:MAG: metalloregulator ArsR/SmtB family transcription factor [Bacteroidia bacterium]|jgi:DNA-binding transcriptional ArsR family regulator|nr:metalloregulator ArsR/SmtB family transcription factor [Bacteroidia bacterium]